MNPNRTTAPSTEPVTLSQAKVHLRVVATDEDDYITALIVAARTACEDRLGRSLITSGWTLTLDSFPSAIVLERGPVIGVTSISYLDADGTTQLLNASAYLVDTTHDIGRIVPAYGLAWPATRRQINAVTVVYTAGYGVAAAVPMPIVQWILLAIGDMYERRERSAEKPAVTQNFADSLLDAYKIWGI